METPVTQASEGQTRNNPHHDCGNGCGQFFIVQQSQDQSKNDHSKNQVDAGIRKSTNHTR